MIIPEGVTTIGDDAFIGCDRLSSVILPCTLVSIGSKSFYNCTALRDISLPKNLKIIGPEAFSRSALSFLDLPESITITSGSAFAYCRSLTSINIPDTVTTIGGSAFHGSNLRSITWPAGTTTIETGLHISLGGRLYSNISISESLIEMTCHSFQDSTAFIYMISHPVLVEIGMFENCNNLQSIAIPEGVTIIGNWIFRQNSAGIPYQVVREFR